MNITSLDDLIVAARAQPEPQRLLFVFTKVELPDDCTPAQRASFEAGSGGALTPLACLDKPPEEIGSFAELLEESRQHIPDWAIVFVAAISGRNGQAPATEDAEAPLNKMVDMIKTGLIGSLIPFDARGETVLIGP
ncbi:MAG TPA: ribonucleotide reductase subunit alpha [Eoetvoesiella sp.]|uniref:ribonucleotide reductase subunit alpha n=1 Tax=Eoetvoesiella sp. TaxID=1966355 RepID=UPI002BAC8495|nr:ribonucleotide reductase subunit alpha [Eoetvoesiella sp.]HWK60589.1 ribonucleotide reductase subunit alpha [Eoetvoesiella sp.]